MRFRELNSVGCGKATSHLPRCAHLKVRIDPDQLYRQVTADFRVNELIKELVANSTKGKPDVFVGSQLYTYDELLKCQGLPLRINRFLGNEWDGCYPNSKYVRDNV